MVYFLKPSYSLRYGGDFNVMEGNNLYYIGGTAVALIVLTILFVYLQRPTFLGCCDDVDKNKDGKKDINWMKTSALAVAVGIIGALAVYGGLMYSSKKSAEAISTPVSSM